MKQLNINIDGQQIAYLENSAGQGGQGDRTVIFIHGNSSSAKTWLPVMAGDLAHRFRCLALDLPGHGRSEPARDQDVYSLPGYASLLTRFVKEVGGNEAVIVGWSLGGQIVLEAAHSLSDAGGFVIFGAPPVASPAQMAEAFLPNPAMGALFSAHVSESEAKLAAESFVAPGSALRTDGFVSDILATESAARTGLAASAGAGRFADASGATLYFTSGRVASDPGDSHDVQGIVHLPVPGPGQAALAAERNRPTAPASRVISVVVVRVLFQRRERSPGPRWTGVVVPLSQSWRRIAYP